MVEKKADIFDHRILMHNSPLWGKDYDGDIVKYFGSKFYVNMSRGIVLELCEEDA